MSHFKQVALQSVTDIVQGGRHKLSGNHFVSDGGFPAYGAGGLNGYLPSAEFDREAVILSSVGARCGKCFFAKEKWSSLANTQVILPDESRVDPLFLWYQLNDEKRWPRAGVAQPFIKPSDVKRHLIVLPPLNEQKRIAAILGQADDLRRKRKQALDRLNQVGQSVFIEMFGDPTASQITSLAEVLTSSSNGVNIEQDSSGVGIPVTRIETIWNGTIDAARVRWTDVDAPSVQRFILKEGDILFSHINSPEHIGKTALYLGTPKPLLHGINLLRLQPDHTKISPIWLLYLLKSRSVRAYFKNRCKKAVNQASLNHSDLAALRFVVPDILEQKAFAARVMQIWDITPKLENALKKQSALFASLQHRAFRGEL
jgi:type I restriction enzyme, S subunit